MRAVQRLRQPGPLPDQVEPGRLEVLRGPHRRDGRADPGVQRRRLGDPGHPGQEDRRDRLGGPQPQPRRGDHRERALAARDQLGQVVAGALARQPGQPGQLGAVRQYRCHADELGPGRAVAKPVDPAGVRRDGAADGGGIPGGQVHAVLEAGFRGVRAQPADRHPGPGGHLRGEGVDGVQPGQPGGREQHRAGRPGRAAAGPSRRPARCCRPAAPPRRGAGRSTASPRRPGRPRRAGPRSWPCRDSGGSSRSRSPPAARDR